MSGVGGGGEGSDFNERINFKTVTLNAYNNYATM